MYLRETSDEIGRQEEKNFVSFLRARVAFTIKKRAGRTQSIKMILRLESERAILIAFDEACKKVDDCWPINSAINSAPNATPIYCTRQKGLSTSDERNSHKETLFLVLRAVNSSFCAYLLNLLNYFPSARRAEFIEF